MKVPNMSYPTFMDPLNIKDSYNQKLDVNKPIIMGRIYYSQMLTSITKRKRVFSVPTMPIMILIL
jgi:hypothetical protein